MRVPWKLVGLAGVAGVAASGAVVVRRRRGHEEYEPDELRDKLRERLAQTRGTDIAGDGGAAPAARGAAAPAPGAGPDARDGAA